MGPHRYPLPKTTKIFLALAALSVMLATSASCSISAEKGAASPGITQQGAPPAFEATSATPAQQPEKTMTFDETTAAIDRAEQELELALNARARSPVTKREGEERSPAVLSPGAQSSKPFAEQPASGGSPVDTSDPCVTACRALASMRRSVEHLCDLTGPGDARCEGARARVSNASDRVRESCPSCS